MSIFFEPVKDFKITFGMDYTLEENVHVYDPSVKKNITLYVRFNKSHPVNTGGRIKVYLSDKGSSGSDIFINLSHVIKGETEFDKSWIDPKSINLSDVKPKHIKMLRTIFDRCGYDLLNTYSGKISEKELISIMQDKIPEFKIT